MPDEVAVHTASGLVDQHVVTAIAVFFRMEKLVSRALLDQATTFVSQIDFATTTLTDGEATRGGTAEHDITVALDFRKRVANAVITVQVGLEIVLPAYQIKFR